MSLLQEVAAHGLAYCAYNQALISIQKLDNAQKMRLINALIDDVCTAATEKYKGDI
jgi:hypothetical protein